MKFKIEDDLDRYNNNNNLKKKVIKGPKVFLVQRKDGIQGYMTEEQFDIAWKKGKYIKKIRELNI